MNLDMTFCHGIRCDKREACCRWVNNLDRQAKIEGVSLLNKRISIAEYSPVDDSECESFLDKEEFTDRA